MCAASHRCNGAVDNGAGLATAMAIHAPAPWAGSGASSREFGNEITRTRHRRAGCWRAVFVSPGGRRAGGLHQHQWSGLCAELRHTGDHRHVIGPAQRLVDPRNRHQCQRPLQRRHGQLEQRRNLQLRPSRHRRTRAGRIAQRQPGAFDGRLLRQQHRRRDHCAGHRLHGRAMAAGRPRARRRSHRLPVQPQRDQPRGRHLGRLRRARFLHPQPDWRQRRCAGRQRSGIPHGALGDARHAVNPGRWHDLDPLDRFRRVQCRRRPGRRRFLACAPRPGRRHADVGSERHQRRRGRRWNDAAVLQLHAQPARGCGGCGRRIRNA